MIRLSSQLLTSHACVLLSILAYLYILKKPHGTKNKTEFTLKAIGGGKKAAEHDCTIVSLSDYITISVLTALRGSE